jgi:SAM-dependent methyltransferase
MPRADPAVRTPIAPTAEWCDCPLCGAPGGKTLYRRDDFAMARCRGCGLVRQNPRRTAVATHGEYRSVRNEPERIAKRREEGDGLAIWQTQPQGAYEAGVAAVVARRRRAGERGLWIDVGSAGGGVLLAARTAGFAVAGVELGAGQVALCRATHGFDVFHGTLVDARFPEHAAEVVSYRHVLEHIHEPLAELAEVRRVLADDGLLLVEVPNYAGLRYLSGRLRATLRRSSPFWDRLNLPEHVYYFTPRTLTALLSKAGFTTLWWTTYGRTRAKPSLLRRGYDRVRDGLRLGNKIRLVAVPAAVTR